MDRRTLMAIVLSAVVLILLPILFEKIGLTPKRTPKTPVDTPLSEAPAEPGSVRQPIAQQGVTGTNPGDAQIGVPPAREVAGGELSAAQATAAAAAFPALAAQPGQEATVRGELYDAQFSSLGARLLFVRLNEYNSAGNGLVSLVGEPTLKIELGPDDSYRYLADANYSLSESTDASGQLRQLRFAAVDTAGLRIVQTYRFDPESYLIDLDVQMDHVLERGITEYRLVLQSWPLITETNVDEDQRYLQVVSRVGSDVKRDKFGDLRKKGPRRHDGAIGWTAVSSKYFAVAAVPVQANAKTSYSSAQELPPGVSIDGLPVPTDRVRGGMVLPVPPPNHVHHFKIYAGPNDYWLLKDAGYNLQDEVDLGWRWLLPFSRTILQIMLFLSDYIPNFGVVIIVLSLLVKVVFHPLTAASMKSMRAMQKVQPVIKELQEKYKKDKQKLNEAVMGVYKEHKVNPIGGCLPMLIQMPVLIALYQVFLHAIDLRQASFFFWINDLSSPDVLFTVAGFPIRALPIIMYGSAYLQQIMTPTDPRQKVTMHLMNIFLLVIFYNLPSGLVLYWTVTNLLTALQQYLVKRGESPLSEKAA
jgi:YidC/Oxa1 family membrane protein insertase